MRLFVSSYQERIYSLAYRMFLNHDDALDASQEALIQADRSLGNFRGEATLDTWVYRLASNVCMNFCRKQAARNRMLDPWDSMQALENLRAEREIEPDAVCEHRARRKMVEAALQKIPDRHRLLVVLHDLEGVSVPEMARILERNPSAIKSGLHRARRALRAILSDGVAVPGEDAAGTFALEAGDFV